MKTQTTLVGCLLLAASVVLVAQGLQGLPGLLPATLLKPATDAWPTYNGDYSGRRFSTLKQLTASNVQTLSLEWASRFTAARGDVQIKSTPLMVNGVLYFTSPNNVWAVDVR